MWGRHKNSSLEQSNTQPGKLDIERDGRPDQSARLVHPRPCNQIAPAYGRQKARKRRSCGSVSISLELYRRDRDYGQVIGRRLQRIAAQLGTPNRARRTKCPGDTTPRPASIDCYTRFHLAMDCSERLRAVHRQSTAAKVPRDCPPRASQCPF